jgi:hypothetical protein
MNSPPAQRLPPASRLREWSLRAALVLGSLLVGLVMLELGARLLRGGGTSWNWSNLVMEERKLNWVRGSDSRAVHDPRLGFVGRPDFHFYFGMTTHDANSWRVAPPPPGVTLAEPPVLVVGDSFAHGDELSDSETWPARLQSVLRRRTVNAAMSGYGLDQIVLRAEADAPKARPVAIVLSFIADDVRRMEMKRVWGAEKPWFDSVDGKLVERNLPVPLPPDPAATLDWTHRLLGRLALVEAAMKSSGWWYEWTADHERVLPAGAGLALVCPLFQRLARLKLPVLAVAEYAPTQWQGERHAAQARATTAAVLRCAEAAGFATLDLFDTIDAAVKAQGLWTVFRQAHPGPIGAELTAQRIAAELEKRQMLAGGVR